MMRKSLFRLLCLIVGWLGVVQGTGCSDNHNKRVPSLSLCKRHCCSFVPTCRRCCFRGTKSSLGLHQKQPPKWSNRLLGLRGGQRARVKNVLTKRTSSAIVSFPQEQRRSTRRFVKITAWTTAAAGVSLLTWNHRQALLQVLNKQKLQNSVLEVLQKFQNGGTTRGLVLYGIGLALWEILGMSTIPVETAAGMAFEYPQALLASAIGKMMGALVAFLVGRLFVSDWVKGKLQNNSVMALVEDSVQHHPLRTCMLFKFSCFPEFIKNFGSSVLLPIQPWMFFLATAVHGWPYSALWTYLGHDTVARMQNEALQANRLLRVLLVVAGIVGLVGSPSLMAWWVRDLKKQSQPIKQNNKR